jgi:glycosyltransferase involved in cell wall biosynthesis
MDKTVSVITPCYNGENFIGRFIESILDQTYKFIELIIVNDGSTDNTEKIIRDYEKKLANRGIKFSYIYKEKNSGQASALNNGLQIFTGDYLIWPDSDDFLFPDSIRERVEFLEDNPDYDFVVTNGYEYHESNLTNPIKKVFNFTYNDNVFLEILLGDMVLNCGYMVRASSFLTVNPDREIFPSRTGQNYQMLLPLGFKYRCGYIDKPLFARVIRENSHSHTETREYEKLILRSYEVNEILLRVLLSIGDEATDLIPKISSIRLRERLVYSYRFGKYDDVLVYYKREYKMFKLLVGQFLRFIIKDTLLVIKSKLMKLRNKSK